MGKAVSGRKTSVCDLRVLIRPDISSLQGGPFGVVWITKVAFGHPLADATIEAWTPGAALQHSLARIDIPTGLIRDEA
jgi:hypothetical protein